MSVAAKRFTVVSLLWLSGAMSALAVPAHAHNAVSKEEFLAIYQPAANRLEDFYRGVRMRVICERTNWPAYEKTGGRRVTELDFQSNGQLNRVDETSILPSFGEKEGSTSIAIASPRPFRAERNGEKAVLLGFSTNDNRRAIESLRAAYNVISAPFGLLDATLVSLISEPNFSLTDVEETTDHGERIVTVSWQRADAWRGKFVFLKDRNWAIREYAFAGAKVTPEMLRDEPKKYYTVRARMEYGESRDGVPLLKTARYWRDRGPTLPEILVEMNTVKELVVGVVPEDQFTLAALGIPTVGERNNGPWVLLWVNVGVAILVIAYLLARRAQKKHRLGSAED